MKNYGIYCLMEFLSRGSFLRFCGPMVIIQATKLSWVESELSLGLVISSLPKRVSLCNSLDSYVINCFLGSVLKFFWFCIAAPPPRCSDVVPLPWN